MQSDKQKIKSESSQKKDIQNVHVCEYSRLQRELENVEILETNSKF